MEVCRAKEPVGVEIRPSHLAECWLHGPEAEIPPDGRRPLEQRGDRASQMRPDSGTIPLLDVHDLKVHFSLRGSFLQRMMGRDTGSVKAVDGVTFTLPHGEVLGLVESAGSGKTTLSAPCYRS